MPVLLPKSGQRFDFPRILPGEIIARPWFDTAIPAVVAGAVIITFVLLIPNALNVGNLYNMTQLYGEYLLVALGLTVVILAGGIDLSVGAVFALANLTTLLLLNYFQWPFYAAATAVIAISCGIGAVNGLLIGYLRLRAFLTTLAVLIIVRAVVDTLLLAYAIKISASSPVSPTWDFLSFKSVFGLPVSFYVAVLVAVVLHVTLTRSRFGWRLQAVGGARRSAFNAGVNVKRTVCLTYVISGGLSGVAGILYAARLANLGADAGLGMELLALTAVVLGGTSLGGGRGSVAKTVLGTVIVLVISTILIRLGLPGGASTLAVGITLLIAVAFDAKWSVFRSSRAGAVRIQPKRHAMSDFPPAESWNKAALAFSYVLNSAHCLPCGGDGGAIDVVSDSAGNIFFVNHAFLAAQHLQSNRKRSGTLGSRSTCISAN